MKCFAPALLLIATVPSQTLSGDVTPPPEEVIPKINPRHHVISDRGAGDFDLNAHIMNLTYQAVQLSALAYSPQPVCDECESLYSYNDRDLDRALVAKVGDYCYAAFRGTKSDNSEDWWQNLDPRYEKACNHLGCCDARAGFVDAYDTAYLQDFEVRVNECVETCSDPEECLVLTGHSQGGAVADVAGVVFAKYAPYIITFGQPPSVYAPCPGLRPRKIFRYINAVMVKDEMQHDVVPFSPSVGAASFGYMIIISKNSYAVACYGLDAKPDITRFHLNVSPFMAHDMKGVSDPHGYVDRIKAIMASATYPISGEGWKLGDPCSDDGECESGRCDNICLERLDTSEPCDEKYDCKSLNCINRYCTNKDGLVEVGFPCTYSSQCVTGRCDGFTKWECKNRKYNHHICNEDSDCLSNECSWWFRCRGNGGEKPDSPSRLRI